METNNYIPTPLDTTEVKLPDELLELAEVMSRNVHEVWAKNRIDQGWTFGPARNDQLKQHPCLVPYDKLPESEKIYDRSTALETLKTLSALGWKLIKEVR